MGKKLILLAESLPKVHPDQTPALSVFRPIFSLDVGTHISFVPASVPP
jgi:hypothetical protein